MNTKTVVREPVPFEIIRKIDALNDQAWEVHVKQPTL